MNISYRETLEHLEFAWVEVPPALPQNLYWGEEAWHERRRAGHTSSFLALGLLVNWVGETELTDRFLQYFSSPQMAKSLNEQSYHALTESQKVCSRSHTDNWACALLGPQGPNQTSLGVDIESRTRVIKPGARRFYEHKDDQTKTLQPLEIWCLKEAAFKALSSYLNFHNLEHSTLVLTDICLQAFNGPELTFSSKGYSGSCGILPEKCGPEGLCTAWAMLRI